MNIYLFPPLHSWKISHVMHHPPPLSPFWTFFGRYEKGYGIDNIHSDVYPQGCTQYEYLCHQCLCMVNLVITYATLYLLPFITSIMFGLCFKWNLTPNPNMWFRWQWQLVIINPFQRNLMHNLGCDHSHHYLHNIPPLKQNNSHKNIYHFPAHIWITPVIKKNTKFRIWSYEFQLHQL